MKNKSIENYTLPELKQLAQELDLSPEQVAEFGDRRRRSTWLAAIQFARRAGKTTQEYRSLPIIKAVEFATKEERSRSLQPGLTWFDDSDFLNRLELFFLRQRRAGLIVPSACLKVPQSMPVNSERFDHWAEWMIPGNLFSTFGSKMRTFQILMIDSRARIFYLPVFKPQLKAVSLPYIRRFAYPVPLPESGRIVEAAEHIKLLHQVIDEPYRCMENWA